MAHPHLILFARLPDLVIERAFLHHVDESTPEFTLCSRHDLAAQLSAHGHLAVADAEDRQPHIEEPVRSSGCVGVMHRGRAARQNHTARIKVADAVFGDLVEGVYFAVNPALSHTACDELSHLAAEVNNENAVGHVRGKDTQQWGRVNDANAQP